MKYLSQDMLTGQTLPSHVQELFWDVDLSRLHLQDHARFIITRILTLGRPEHIRWVLKRYSSQHIIAAIRTTKHLDFKTANFWALHFDIPREQIACFQKS